MIKRFLAVVIVLALLAGISLPAAAQDERISEFGRYEGYTAREYDEVVCLTEYVAMRDGVRLAVDIIRPAHNGVPTDEPLPVIWSHTRYGRGCGNFHSHFVGYGYVVAQVDARGTGDSEGLRLIDFSPLEARDAYDMTEWLAAQPWSTGKIGMGGRSYLGTTQMWAASQAPPSLVAIMPEMHLFDQYHDVGYQNGILMMAGVRWMERERQRDASTGHDQTLLSLLDTAPSITSFPYRDSALDPVLLGIAGPLLGYDESMGPAQPHALLSPHSVIEQINASGVAIYQIGGWLDTYPASELRWFGNLTGPQRLVMTDWDHGGRENWLITEARRWFDYWLKGIDNGIMDEPPLRYTVINAADPWRTADTWPLSQEERQIMYFSPESAGSIASVNDGSLVVAAPAGESATAYTVDYTLSMGETNRWSRAMEGRQLDYASDALAAHAERALTFTSPPLDADLEVTGHPVVHVWVSATATDSDVFVYLEEVTEAGPVYVTEGRLRASRRALNPPPYANFGLPWHGGYESDIQPLTPGEPVELVFDLLPTGYLFRTGNQLRVVITGADAYGFEALAYDPPAVLTLYQSEAMRSYIDLPVIPGE